MLYDKYIMHKELILDWLKEHKSSTLPAWLNRNQQIKNWVLQQTSQYTTKNIMESVYIILNGEQPICEFNNPKQFNTFDLGYRKGCILGNKCKCVSNLRMKGLKTTLQKKYGVDNINNIPGITEKRQTTMLERHGVPFASQSALIKEKSKITNNNKSNEEILKSNQKRKQTYIEKYGVEHHMKLQSQQDKVFATNLKKYNAKVPMQNADICKKTKETYAARYQTIKNIEDIESLLKDPKYASLINPSTTFTPDVLLNLQKGFPELASKLSRITSLEFLEGGKSLTASEQKILGPIYNWRGTTVSALNEKLNEAKKYISNQQQMEEVYYPGFKELKPQFDAIYEQSGKVPSVPNDVGGGGQTYQLNQIIDRGGKRYRVIGGSADDPDIEEVK